MVKATRRPCDVTTGHVRVSFERKDYKDGSSASLVPVSCHHLTVMKWHHVPVYGTKAHVGNSSKVPLILTLTL